MVTRTISQAFDEYLQRLTPTDTQRSAGASHRRSVYDALNADLPLVSMFESGSFSHGTGVRNHSDTDVFAWLEYQTQPASSWDVLTRLKGVLKTRFPLTPVFIDPPAVIVSFGGGYEQWEVIPAYITGLSDDLFQIPSHSWAGGWIYSAPKTHLAYVNACNERPHHGNAKSLARLVKAWKYVNKVPISSFYLEMRCADYVSHLSTFIPVFDLCYILEQMSKDSVSPLNDPSGLTGDIQPCGDDEDLAKARHAVSGAAFLSRDTLRHHMANNPIHAFAALSVLFNGEFPAQYT